MAKDLISKKTRYEFREYFVGTTLREIEAAFDAADVSFDISYIPVLSGQRRSLVEQYYHTIDWTKWVDVQKVPAVYENVLIELEQTVEGGGSLADAAKRLGGSLRKWLEKDGFEYVSGKLLPAGRQQGFPDVQAIAVRFDFPELNRQIERMKQSVDSDPALTIGTPKELIETTCKSILIARSVTMDPSWDVPELVKHVRKVLKLLPDDISDSVKGADIIRRLLSNLGTIAHSMAELRNLYGTGHGWDGKSRGLGARHARMVSSAAAALATFLLDSSDFGVGHRGRI